MKQSILNTHKKRQQHTLLNHLCLQLLLLTTERCSINLLNVRILDKDQEQQLEHVSTETHHNDLLTSRNETQAIVEGIAHSVHGMRKHLKDAIKCQILLEQKKEITPVPSIVTEHAMSIGLGPNVEQAQRYAHNVQHEIQQSKRLWCLHVSETKDEIGSQIGSKHQIDNDTVGHPGIELHGIVLQLVRPAVALLGTHVLFEQELSTG